MAKYRDWMFQQSNFIRASEYTDTDAVILNIRNILLSRKGNYPDTPSFGMNIEKYQFDLLDQTQIDIIRAELAQQIVKYIPDISGVHIGVEIVSDETGVINEGRNMLGISVSSKLNSQSLNTNFLLYEKSGELTILNETH
jgi:phage baseplate assembly protein W